MKKLNIFCALCIAHISAPLNVEFVGAVTGDSVCPGFVVTDESKDEFVAGIRGIFKDKLSIPTDRFVLAIDSKEWIGHYFDPSIRAKLSDKAESKIINPFIQGKELVGDKLLLQIMKMITDDDEEYAALFGGGVFSIEKVITCEYLDNASIEFRVRMPEIGLCSLKLYLSPDGVMQLNRRKGIQMFHGRGYFGGEGIPSEENLEPPFRFVMPVKEGKLPPTFPVPGHYTYCDKKVELVIHDIETAISSYTAPRDICFDIHNRDNLSDLIWDIYTTIKRRISPEGDLIQLRKTYHPLACEVHNQDCYISRTSFDSMKLRWGSVIDFLSKIGIDSEPVDNRYLDLDMAVDKTQISIYPRKMPGVKSSKLTIQHATWERFGVAKDQPTRLMFAMHISDQDFGHISLYYPILPEIRRINPKLAEASYVKFMRKGPFNPEGIAPKKTLDELVMYLAQDCPEISEDVTNFGPIEFSVQTEILLQSRRKPCKNLCQFIFTFKVADSEHNLAELAKIEQARKDPWLTVQFG